jgi:membrane fusion protein, macrolide-specific efflux system
VRVGKHKKTLAVLALLLIGGGVWAWRATQKSEPPPMQQATVTRGDIELTIAATGVVQPRNRLEIKPPVAGRVEEVRVREGQSVARGELLIMMSSSERAALLDAASAKGPDELKRWQELYRPTPIYAPMSGTVIARSVEPGQTVTAQDPVLVMSDRLAVKAKVDETDIAKVQPRQVARIILDAYPSQVLTATVGQVAFEAKTVNNVITYEVEVLPERVPPFMRSGMTATVSFVVTRKRNVALVPTEAVQSRGGRTGVLLPPADPKGRPSLREVKLGISDGRRTEVLAGLNEGDVVLIPPIGAVSREPTGTNPFGPNFRRR